MTEVAHELRDLARAAQADAERTAVLPVPPPAPAVPEPATPTRPVAAALALPVRPVEPPPPGPDTGDDGASADRSRRWLLPLLGVVAAVLVVVAAAFVAGDLFGGDDGDPAADESDATSAAQRRSEDTPGSTAATNGSTPESTPESDPPPTTESSTGELASTSPEQFVTDYYALLPDDTRGAWALLSDEMQDEVGSYGSYQGFWRTVEAVTVDDTSVDSTDTVTVDLTYTTASGTESETRLITVQDTGDGPQIVGDQVAAS
ncbi:hypothetical protein SFC88_13360 [Nocardioides sp. HM23]|uniref:hypothetical protein n=1 Tax=Nocardioides bizhenqiangii TaxID=3095076 RepID=UPI002ACA2279|nr:hypothetical protein [Nocardioides sp. HM23]MDZ5621828.1 hypothetical protein [Nocardioides sp. HM23]